jgi:putative tryptophan/tyrosine transport system substrate-binding protein
MVSGDDPRRRDFLAGLGAAAVLSPLGALAQSNQQMRRIGILFGLAASADAPLAKAFLVPFRTAMREAGWIEDGNVQIDYRYGGALSDLSKTRAYASELVGLSPDLIYAQGLPATLALHKLTTSIPIVFTQLIDPVGFGLAQSLGHPGGNITGFIIWDFEIGGKWLQLLLEMAPHLTRVGVVFNPDTTPYAGGLIAAAKQAANGVSIIECRTHDDAETEAVLSDLSAEPNAGAIVIPEPFTSAHRDHIIASCARYRLPAMISIFGAKENGALLSYTLAYDEMVHGVVADIDRILKGAAPRDIPIQAPTKYELAINLKTAKALGLDVPVEILARADQVIE